MSTFSARPVAVVLDGYPIPAWQARALENLTSSATLAVVETRLEGPLARSASRRIAAAIDARVFGLGPDALAPAPAPSEAPVRAAAGEGRSAATLVVWLSERPPPAGEPTPLLHLRHGGREQPVEDALGGALLADADCLETEIVLGGEQGSLIVERTVSAVRPFSLSASCNQLLWKLAVAIPRAAERAPGLAAPTEARAPAGSAPSAARLLGRSLRAWLRAPAQRLLFTRPWQVRVRRRQQRPTAGWSHVAAEVRFRSGHVYADPFLFEHDGRHHLFCEEVLPGTGRGVISHTELPLDAGPADPPQVVLSEPHHLSYPFVFAHEGDLYLVPESSAASRVQLYRAVDFPRRWERDAILLEDVDAADATLLLHEGRWWLFASVAAVGASSLDELHLYFAEDLRGPWQPHPRNPVVSDVRCARPAGAIQRWGSRLIRLGQDGSRRYGWAVSFREIDTLSTSDYAEHEIDRIEPGEVGGARATHTYSADSRFEAIDLRRREPRGVLRHAWLPGLRRGRGCGPRAGAASGSSR